MSRFINLQLNVEGAQAERALGRFTQNIEAAIKASNGITSTNKKNQQSASEFFGQQARSLGQMALGFAGVGSAIAGIATASRLVLAEVENLNEKQRATSTANLTFEQGLAQAVRNAAGIFDAGTVRQKSLDIAAEAGISPAKAAGIVGSALTSTGVTNEQEANLALRSAKAAAVFAPDLDIAGTESLAGVASSTAKRFGVTPEAAIGFIQRVGTQSNVRELTPLIENVAPVLSNLSEFGFNPEDAGALLATLTQGIGDTTGETSGTAAINFAKSLRDRFGNQEGFTTPSGQFDPIAAILELQGDADLRSRFFEGGEFFGRKFGKASLGKGKAVPTLEGLLTSDETVQGAQFFGSRSAIKGFGAGEETYNDLVSQIKSVTATEQTGRILDSFLSINQANDPTGISAVLREKIPNLEQQFGVGAFGQNFNSITRELYSGFGNDPVAAIDKTQAQFAAEADEFRRGRLIQQEIRGRHEQIIVPEQRAPVTQRDIEQASNIDKLITALEEIQQLVEVRVQVNNRPADKADVRTPPGDRPSQALTN